MPWDAILGIIGGLIGLAAILIPWWISRSRAKEKADKEAEVRQAQEELDQREHRKTRQDQTRDVNESIDRQREAGRKWRDGVQKEKPRS